MAMKYKEKVRIYMSWDNYQIKETMFKVRKKKKIEHRICLYLIRVSEPFVCSVQHQMN